MQKWTSSVNAYKMDLRDYRDKKKNGIDVKKPKSNADKYYVLGNLVRLYLRMRTEIQQSDPIYSNQH